MNLHRLNRFGQIFRFKFIVRQEGEWTAKRREVVCERNERVSGNFDGEGLTG